GSDNNDGLAPTVGGGHGPWASPIKADTSAVAGTSGPCTAASGWFTETASICIHILDGSTGWYAAAQNRSYSKGGTSESTRVVYVADNQYGPKWVFTSGTNTDFFPGSPYITFAGLDVSSGTGAGNFDGTGGSGYNKNAYMFESNAAHIHFIGNKIHDIAQGQCTGH